MRGRNYYYFHLSRQSVHLPSHTRGIEYSVTLSLETGNLPWGRCHGIRLQGSGSCRCSNGNLKSWSNVLGDWFLSGCAYMLTIL